LSIKQADESCATFCLSRTARAIILIAGIHK
jgi:hypothetical protein